MQTTEAESLIDQPVPPPAARRKSSLLDRPLFASLTLNVGVVVFLVIVGLAVTSRLADLGVRAMSHDENSHVYYSWMLYRGRGYSHDPVTHGPLQFHLLALSYFLFGANDFTGRLPQALCSIAAVAFMWMYRRYLGRAGALVAAGLMLISPYMLFYGRYARNEAFVALFGVVTLWAMLRYFETGRPRYMYALTAATVLHFTSKETAFIYTAQALLFLGFTLLVRAARLFRQRPLPTWRELWGWLRQERAFDMLMVTGTLVLPMLAPFPVRVLGLNPIQYQDQKVLMVTGGVIIALAAIAAAAGLLWKPRFWLINAAIFYAIFTVFYTTVFTNGIGFVTGLVGSLGYWLEQQGVNRGGQPMYYYALLQIPVYEYLPALGALLAAVFGISGWLMKPKAEKVELVEIGETDGSQPEAANRFERDPERTEWPPLLPLLVFWSITSLMAYSYAGEKMPWLTVHITLPLILLAGWGLGRLIESIDWNLFRTHRGVLVLALLALFLVTFLVGFGLLFGLNMHQAPGSGAISREIIIITSLACALISGAGLVWLTRTWPTNQFNRLLLLSFFGLLGLLTARTAYQAAFINYDYATEYLVYAHSTDGIKQILSQIDDISQRVTGGKSLAIAYDNESRYPFWWYLRDYTNITDFGDNPTRALRDIPIILVGDDNYSKIEQVVADRYYEYDYQRIWWPNQDYWNLKWSFIEPEIMATRPAGSPPAPMTVPEYLGGVWRHIQPFFTNPAVRSAVWQIWLNRDYRQWAALKNTDMSLPNWNPSKRMRMYVRKDIAAQIWNYGSDPSLAALTADPYQEKTVTLEASQVVGSAGTEPGQFQKPRDLAFAPDGSVWAADTGNHRLQHLDAQGNVLGVVGSFSGAQAPAPGGQFNEPWGIAVGPDGSVYVTDTWNHRIQKFTADGVFVKAWGFLGQTGEPTAFYGPRDVAVDTEGRVFVTDTGNKRVVIFDADGSPLGQFGTAGMDPGQFDEPVGLAIDPQGNVYVADTWNQRIQVFAQAEDGTYQPVRSWDVSAWFGQSVENKPYLAADALGHVFAVDPEGYRVIEFTSDGQVVRVWGDFGEGLGEFGQPASAAVSPTGDLWVSDAGNNRLMVFPAESLK